VRRRHLLALCAAGVSGCAGLGSGGDGGNGDGGLGSPTPTPTATATPTSTGTPTATPVRRADTQRRPIDDEDLEPLREIIVDLLPERVPFSHGALVEAVENEDDTIVPRLTVRVRNRSGRARELETPTRGIPLPTRRLRGPNGNGILLRREFPEGAGTCPGSVTPTPEPTSTPSGTPTATPEPTATPASTVETREIEPGATVTRTYRVFSDPSNPDGCFPEGRYRLDQRYVAVTDGDRLPYRWGFSLAVRD
jgi:hypothetical protein